MGAIKGSASYLRFLVDGEPAENAAKVYEDSLESRRFLPLHADAEAGEQAGWMPIESPYDDTAPFTAESFQFGHLIAVAYREDKYAIPKPVLARAVKERIEKIEREEQREITKQFQKAVEKAVLVELKRKSFPRTRLCDVIWDLTRKEVRFFGRGTLVTERASSLFERTFKVRVEQGSYAARAFTLDLPTRAKGVLEQLSPGWLFPDLVPSMREADEDEEDEGAAAAE
jgi:hypothetical protein